MSESELTAHRINNIISAYEFRLIDFDKLVSLIKKVLTIS